MSKMRYLALFVVVAGCTGAIDIDEGALAGESSNGTNNNTSNMSMEEASSQDEGWGDNVKLPTNPETGEPIEVPLHPIRHLTRSQYANAIRDLLGFSPDISHFAPDDAVHGFEVGLSISPLLSEDYFNTASDLATQATENVPELTGCSADPSDSCINDFVARFARRAYRRSLTSEELLRFEQLYQVAKNETNARDGITQVVHAALASPYFLYIHEPFEDAVGHGDVVPVRGTILATRLAMFIWNSIPDEILLDDAEAGHLDQPAVLARTLTRMIEDPRARSGFANMTRQWFELDEIERSTKDEDIVSNYPPVAENLRLSIELFIDDITWQQRGGVADLFLDNSMFVNTDIDAIINYEAASQQFEKVELPPNERAGLLTQPAILTMLGKPNQSDPVHRGVFVREQILCGSLPPPPPDVEAQVPEPEPGQTTRERFAQHSSDPSCRGCHELIDPIGFGFENYDTIGRYREVDNGRPVDASGEVIAAGDADGAFDGTVELSRLIATSDTVLSCAAKQLFRMGTGRLESEYDKGSIARITESARSDDRLQHLLALVAQVEAFRYRRVPSLVKQ